MNMTKESTEILKVRGHYVSIPAEVISDLKKYCRLLKVLDPLSSQKVWYIAGKN